MATAAATVNTDILILFIANHKPLVHHQLRTLFIMQYFCEPGFWDTLIWSQYYRR